MCNKVAVIKFIFDVWENKIVPTLPKVHDTKWLGFDGEKDGEDIDNVFQTSSDEIIHTEIQQQQHLFNGPLSGTTRVSRYQKGQTKLDFTAARDSEWLWNQLAICKSAPHPGQIIMPAPHH